MYQTIDEIFSGKYDGKTVKLRGWLHHMRTGGGILFLQLREGTGVIQCTLKKDAVGPEEFERLARIPIESTVEISGTVRNDPRAPRGYEISGEKVTILYPAEEGYPIAKKYHGPDFLLDNRHLFIRDPKVQAMLRVRAQLIEALRRWLIDHGYLEVHVPILVNAAVEGGSTLFEVKYFDQKAYLTQSWQLYAEAMISSVGKIFTLAPSFRAEKSRTRRHLTEYWHLEVEEPWLDLDGLMALEEHLVSYACQHVRERNPEELKLIGRNPQDLKTVEPPFPRIRYDEAVELVQKARPEFKWGEDMGWEEEKVLTEDFDKPFFVSHFPKGVKAFYHLPDPNNPKVTLSTDLLAPEGFGEITGGGQRIHDLTQLLDRIKEDGLKADDYKWYVELRRYGTVPHSGFGMGVERTLSWICKLEHIRDSIAFPRLINRVYP
ncbi:MAG TPA: asparagine--tRNA ligase [Candidatus Bathyarchaeia archaeon]|nr:asparagine--tRNA ligase [Candidatus Bathyarchaeia archaeon]